MKFRYRLLPFSEASDEKMIFKKLYDIRTDYIFLENTIFKKNYYFEKFNLESKKPVEQDDWLTDPSFDPLEDFKRFGKPIPKPIGKWLTAVRK